MVELLFIGVIFFLFYPVIKKNFLEFKNDVKKLK
jgi:cbb3-type cytochrome oxidase subunit 3